MSEWIKIEDEEPPAGKSVLLSDGTFVKSGWRRNPEIYGVRAAKFDSATGAITTCTHWMPLPPPPATT